MQIKTKTSRKKPIILTLVTLIVLISVASVVYCLFVIRSNPTKTTQTNTSNTTDYTPPTQEQIDTGKQVEESQEEDTEESAPATKVPVVTITSTIQNESTVTIRSLIDIATNEGDCILTVTNGTKTITRLATLQALASSSTCKGFDVSVADLGPGSWKITLNVTVDGKTGTGTHVVNIK